MASKKKSRGKAKKMAKKAEQKQEAATQQGALDEQMERLKIERSDEAALLDEAIKLAAAEKEALDVVGAEQEERAGKLVKNQSNGCYHGYVDTDDRFIIEDFCKTFVAGFTSLGGVENGEDYFPNFRAGTIATKEKYLEMWSDSSKLKLAVSLCFCNGTHHVLEGNIELARLLAAIACYFQEYASVQIDNQRPSVTGTTLPELFLSDEHTLVQYLRKNIPCSCLQTKYEEVKSITKMGMCCNDKCSLPKRMVERRSMFYCARCRAPNCCSRECQKADWPVHKEYCDQLVDLNAMWESRKQP